MTERTLPTEKLYANCLQGLRIPSRITVRGRQWTTSLNAGRIEFRGGPADGQSALEDCNLYDSYGFSIQSHRVSFSYKPLAKGRSWIYQFDPRSVSWW